MAVVALASLIEQDPEVAASVLDHPAQLLASLAHRVPSLPAAYRSALHRAAEHPDLLQLLHTQLKLSTSHAAASCTEPGPSNQAEVISCSSQWAGAALLLPLLCAHRIHRFLDAEQLHRVVIGALDPADRQPASNDLLLHRLFGVPPPPDAHPTRATRQDHWAPIPAEIADHVHPEAQRLRCSADAGPWSALLLALFTSRLPGLHASSARYLRRQFLAVPGTLHVSAKGLRVALVGPGLALVVSTAGLAGPQPPLPWLGGRSLELVLGGERS